MDMKAYLRQIAQDEWQQITALHAAAADQITDTSLEWGARRNVYNLEINNANNAAETVRLYTGDSTNTKRVQKREYTIGAYAVVCLFIDIDSPILTWQATNTSAAPYNTALYGTVTTNPVNIAVGYYDDFVH